MVFQVTGFTQAKLWAGDCGRRGKRLIVKDGIRYALPTCAGRFIDSPATNHGSDEMEECRQEANDQACLLAIICIPTCAV
jgi:hypothetical protein